MVGPIGASPLSCDDVLVRRLRNYLSSPFVVSSQFAGCGIEDAKLRSQQKRHDVRFDKQRLFVTKLGPWRATMYKPLSEPLRNLDSIFCFRVVLHGDEKLCFSVPSPSDARSYFTSQVGGLLFLAIHLI